MDFRGADMQAAEAKDWELAKLREALKQAHLMEAALACYADDEDRYLADEGEPYGGIPTEVGMIARAARQRMKARALNASPPAPQPKE